MAKIYFYNKGHLILFCDEKRLCLGLINKFNNPSHKIYSKNINKILFLIMVLVRKKTVLALRKNSKYILQYNLEKIEENLINPIK